MIVNPQVFSRPRSTNFAQALDPFSQGLGFSAPRFSQVPAFDFSSFASPTYGSVSNVYGGLGLLDANPTGINQFMQNYGLLSNTPAQNFGTQPNQPAPQPVPNFQPPPLPPVDTSVYQPGGSTDSSGPVANLSNFGPDVGNGGLFGGGPMSGVTPTQLPGPRIPTFVDPPRGMEGQPGYGNIAQPTLGGNVGGDFMGSAQNYFGIGMDSRGPATPMTPEDILRQAQSRMMQQDVKSPEVQAYLDNIIQTGGRPTMMAPDMSGNLMSVLPNGGMVAGQPGSGFGLPSGNEPGGVTLRPTPGAMPI